MQTFTCQKCGWSTDEASAGWDRLSKLGTCPRCDAKRDRWAFFRSPRRMGIAAGKLGLVLGFSALLGGTSVLLFGDVPFLVPIRVVAISGFAAWVYGWTPKRPLR